MKFFTISNFIKTALCLAATFVFVNVQAQEFQLTINSPAGSEASYAAVVGSFGPAGCEVSGVTADCGLADDGTALPTEACNALVNDLTGQIAIIDRGSCNFSIKCYNAQTAGAVAAIVCNNVDDPIFAMAPGDFADDITIPCLMVSRQDCAEFRDLIGDGVNASVEAVTTAYPEAVVVWGAAGEGSFDGGLNGWSTSSISCSGADAEGFEMWRWTGTGAAEDAGCGSGNIASPTVCNGAMYFQSNLYDDEGDCGATVGSGPCPAPQMGALISPIIDLSASTAPAVSLRFTQNTRQFNSQYFVSWSDDGGANWTDIEINQDLVTNDPATNDVQRILLNGANLTDQFQVRFMYNANYYFWLIDDVQIIEAEANNMRVNANFYSIPNNAVTPVDQVDPVYFLADIQNVGSAEQTNVNLNVSIFDATDNVIYSQDLNYGAIGADSLAENVPFAEAWTPPATAGEYTGVYTVSADSADFDESNNSVAFDFFISENNFAKETGRTRALAPATANWDDGAPHSWAMGNVFHINTSEKEIDGEANVLAVANAEFHITGPADNLAGQSVTLWLYEWDNANNDDIAQLDELTRVGFDIYVFDASMDNPLVIETSFIDFLTNDPSQPILLNAGKDYVLMLEHSAADDVNTLFLEASGDFDYSAQYFVNNPLGGDNGLAIGEARWTSVLAIPSDGDMSSVSEYGTTAFGRDIVPVIRLETVWMSTVGTEDILSDDNIMTVYPNPTSDLVNLDLDLVQASDLELVIFDPTGKIILSQKHQKVDQQRMTFDVSNYTAGVYHLAIYTNEGVKMKRFFVQK